jgi:hypothetical protein
MGATHHLLGLVVPLLALTACASANGGAADEGDPLQSEDLGATSSALSGCLTESDFHHFACPASWQAMAGPQSCDCVESRYDCQAPNPQESINGTANRARFLNTASPNGTWPLRTGITIYDGRHQRIATTADTATLLNFGQKKAMNGRTYVYGLGMGTSTPDAAKPGSFLAQSGWIDAACVGWDGKTPPAAGCEQAPLPADAAKMKVVQARRPPASAEDVTRYQIAPAAPGWASAGGIDNYKVVCQSDSSHESLGDYLPRPRENGRLVTVNLLMTLPGMKPALSGMSDDTLVVAHQENGSLVSEKVSFYRLMKVRAVGVPLYTPGTDDLIAGHPSAPFVYGYVKYQKDASTWVKRYGWISYFALEHVGP